MKASLKNYRQSPRKVRLVAKSVKGKSAAQALVILDFMPKRAAEPLRKLIESAVANAKMPGTDLVIQSIEVNKGVTLKRSRPRARGSAFPINKRTSHVLVTLAPKSGAKPVEQKTEEVPKVTDTPKVVKKTAVKKVAKKAVKKVAK
jgi:large subunit ribosomal protein L22